MRRDAMQQLYDWKEKTTRKPLIVRGARQVGKTWLMKEFASSAYRQFAYINFEDNEVMKDVFQKDFDVERILMAIQLVTGIVVDTETLIIFDEIQEAPRGLTALKYFLPTTAGSRHCIIWKPRNKRDCLSPAVAISMAKISRTSYWEVIMPCGAMKDLHQN